MNNLSFNTQMGYQSFFGSKLGGTSCTWEKTRVNPFNELLISWNAQRPLQGQYVILVSVYLKKWTSWLLYAVWGTEYQYSFHDRSHDDPIRSFQDQVEILEDQTATGYRIRVEACGGANLDHFDCLFACTSYMERNIPQISYSPHFSINHSLAGLSQFSTDHPRANCMCSPTSTTAVLQHVLANHRLNLLHFADKVYDAGFNIYGNWSFNVAQAYVELGSPWRSWCARSFGFKSIWPYLIEGLPVVVSVKGILPGTLLPYSNGHLVVIKGYNALTKEILCVDPAFPSNEQTEIAFPLNKFIEAWAQRGYLTYFFCPKLNDRQL